MHWNTPQRLELPDPPIFRVQLLMGWVFAELLSDYFRITRIRWRPDHRKHMKQKRGADPRDLPNRVFKNGIRKMLHRVAGDDEIKRIIRIRQVVGRSQSYVGVFRILYRPLGNIDPVRLTS